MVDSGSKPRSNRAVVWTAPNKVEIRDVGYPKMEHPVTHEQLPHAAIIKVLLSAICGSDLHAYKGRTSAQPGNLVFGHEMCGEIVEVGPGVEKDVLKVGDWVSVPFNISCGTCNNCKHRNFAWCQRSGGLGGIYGYAAGGGWQGGQAQYALIPWAQINCMVLPEKIKQNPQKLMDVVMISDIVPTGYHGSVSAGVEVGSTVYIAGAGPVGLCATIGAKMLGASKIFVGDMKPDRLALAQRIGAVPIDLRKMDMDDAAKFIESQIGKPEVDCVVDAVGYEATGHKGEAEKDDSMAAFNGCIHLARTTAKIGCPGAYFTGDPGGADKYETAGQYRSDWGKMWMKGLAVQTGQCPVQRYNRRMLNMIVNADMPFSQLLNGTRITLDQAPQAFQKFAAGEAVKYVIDPNGILGQ